MFYRVLTYNVLYDPSTTSIGSVPGE